MPEQKIYCVDSNSFMDWQARYYPVDVFPGLVTKMDHLIEKRRILAPSLVQEELQKVGTPDLVKWINQNKKIIVQTKDILNHALKIQNQFPGLLDPKAEYEEADAYVIALAQMQDGIVVTQETSATEKRKPARPLYIPDVCRELGVTCISILGSMRREDWQF